MNMTHYMELLATNQPWNLIMYMVIPVALAEALVATEFFLPFFCVAPKTPPGEHGINGSA